MLIGPKTSVDTIYAQFLLRYKKDDKIPADIFKLAPTSFAAIDANQNGSIEKDELADLTAKVKPHIRLLIGLGEPDAENSASGATLRSLSSELGAVEKIVTRRDGHLSIVLPGVILQIAASHSQVKVDYAPAAQSMIRQYDADNNNYLKIDEVLAKVNNDNAREAQRAQFAAWDSDGDAVVVAADIEAMYDRTQRPQQSKVNATTAEPDDTYFALVDTSGDGQLSAREVADAASRLASLDKNNDAMLKADEIPDVMTVRFRRGTENVNSWSNATGNARNSRCGPQWFRNMDRNGDGDVTMREFLGAPAQFKRLDRNGDGFIDSAEAVK